MSWKSTCVTRTVLHTWHVLAAESARGMRTLMVLKSQPAVKSIVSDAVPSWG
jgi:hypothetical protein